MSGHRGGTYWIETWGCQMNALDSDKIAGAMESRGFLRANDVRDADVVLLNTCAIREKAEEKVFSEIGRLVPLKRRRPDLVLGVCGCVGQQQGSAIFERAPHVDLVVGPRAAGSIPGRVERIRAGDESARWTADLEYRDDSILFPYDRIRREGTGAGKAFVTVIEGCNHRCTFCVVPRTRGPESSRPMGDVLAEVRDLAAKGVREVEFLGQTVNAYRDPSGMTLSDLILEASRVDGVERIRFTTSHPAQMTDRLMDAMAEAAPKLCPYLHLPVQSGSSAVLRAMRRGYDREGYLRKLEGLRRRMPGIALGTDVIVGFPAESERDFRETLTLLDEVRYDQMYSFAYSARPGTAAHALTDPIPHEEKMERLARLQARQREIQLERHRAWIGRDVDVLVEGPSRRDGGEWTGRTPEARIVNFAGASAPGRTERIRIVEASPFALRGEPAEVA